MMVLGWLFSCGFIDCFLAVKAQWSDVIFHAAEKLLVLLRDGRKLLGILRSFDQFGTNIISSIVVGNACKLCSIF